MDDGPTGSPDPRPRVKSRIQLLIVLAFALVALGALGATSLAVVQTRKLQAGAQELVSNMLTSVRLLGQIDTRVQRRRILIDDHIFARDAGEMRALEQRIAALDNEISLTSRAYEPWVTLPGERAAWNRAEVDLAALDEPVSQALALSRQNRDVEAWRKMDEVAAQWELVGHDFDTLVAINDRGAANGLARFSGIRRRLMLLLCGLGVATFIETGVTGWWAARMVARRERDMLLHARVLEERNRELDAFAGRVAHDIRGPLTTMRLAMTPLGSKLPRDDRTVEVLGRGVGRMEHLVEDLLALARVESQVHGHCDPAAVVAEVQADFAPRIAAENGALRVSVKHAEVSCSEGLLRQAVTNLVENAVKYHRPEAAPEVEISGATDDGSYDLRVTDNGVGMSAEETEHASRPFYRSPRIRDRPGTGLGLSIVSRVAEASGGKLSVESRLGRGSTFVVRLPLFGTGHLGGGGAGH